MLRATPPTGLLPLALALLLSTPALAKAPTHLPDKEEQKLNEGLGDPPEKLDRSTPFKAWTALLDSCRSGQKELGAHLLNLGEIRKEERKTKGAVLAHNLCLVLKKVGKLTAEGIDDTALGPIVDDKPTNYVIAARFETSLGPREVWLRRFKETSTDSHHWLLTRRTVSEIESWQIIPTRQSQHQRVHKYRKAQVIELVLGAETRLFVVAEADAERWHKALETGFAAVE